MSPARERAAALVYRLAVALDPRIIVAVEQRAMLEVAAQIEASYQQQAAERSTRQ